MSAASPTLASRPARPAARRISARLLRSELRLIAGRRRNQAGMAVLGLVPVIIAIAVKLSAPRPGEGPDFTADITSNGLFVPLAALTVEMVMFLPLSVAMLAGDAIAGEANQGTLRYLLTVPVDRTRLLVTKFISLIIGSFLGILAVAIPGAVIGLALFGGGPMTTLSGSQLSMTAAVGRLLLVIAYLAAALSALAAVGLFFSTLTEQPIAVTIAVMILNILMWILQGIEQVAWLHPFLLVDHIAAFGDLLRDPISWAGPLRGLITFAAYAAIAWLLAWARFAGKDITS
ncbi:MAG: ABC transporter permease [Tetrasphaera sp.]